MPLSPIINMYDMLTTTATTAEHDEPGGPRRYSGTKDTKPNWLVGCLMIRRQDSLAGCST